MKKIILGVCCLLVITLLLSTRWATTAVNTAQGGGAIDQSDTSVAIDLSIEEMVNQSNLIAIGNCLETRSIWIDRNLVTLATISVAETLKGNEAEKVTVVLPGGVDANRKFPVAMTYPGAPRITPGEDVLLFLTQDDEIGGGYTITGFSQGKFSIVKDEDGQEMISRDLTRVALRGKAGVRRGMATLTALSSLKAQVKRHLKKE